MVIRFYQAHTLNILFLPCACSVARIESFSREPKLYLNQ